MESGPWQSEYIPDEDSVFYRVPVGHLKANRLPHPGVFKENKGSMSVDWEKYSSAAQTRARPGKPERFAVLRLSAAAIRAINNLSLVHEPTFEPQANPPNINRAHSGVYGVASPLNITEIGYAERVRLELFDLVKNRWEIDPDSPVTA